jgi:hypothetical protein
VPNEMRVAPEEQERAVIGVLLKLFGSGSGETL